MDRITKERRSANMSRIRSRDTKPEMLLRKALWSRGVRGYRVHPKGITGKPDVAFIGKKVLVFVDGCFYHKCPDCFVAPSSNTGYWGPKLDRNQQRDAEVTTALESEGWTVVRVWEHEIEKDVQAAVSRIESATSQPAGR